MLPCTIVYCIVCLSWTQRSQRSVGQSFNSSNMVLFNSEREKSTFGYGILCGWLLVLVMFLVVCLIKCVYKQCRRINDEISSSVLINEISIGTRKQSVDERSLEFLFQDIKEKLQSLQEILRPKETRISMP